MNCPFCDIKERALYKGKHAFVIFSNPRLVPCHLLVVPSRHVVRLSELSDEERKELFDTVIDFQERILGFASGCDIKQHYRPFLPDSRLKVSHLHVHLVPRELNDELYTKCMIHEDALFKELTKEEINKYSDLLKIKK